LKLQQDPTKTITIIPADKIDKETGQIIEERHLISVSENSVWARNVKQGNHIGELTIWRNIYGIEVSFPKSGFVKFDGK